MEQTDEKSRRQRRGRRAARPRRRVSVVGVMGEIFLTAGVVLLLFVSWQMWFGDMIIGSQKQAEANALAQQWEAQAAESTPTPEATTEPDVAEPEAPIEPAAVPVMSEPDPGAEFGIMYVPRFGPDWQFTIANGTGKKSILDAGYVGHYEGSAMPGADGNMAVAAHRWTSGAPFDPVDKLVVGDAIVVRTQDGWYTYRFRNVEYVQDTAIEVLNPVPQQVDVTANGKYLTLTSCAPKLNMLERIISYAVFEEFTPTSAGPPASLSEGGAA